MGMVACESTPDAAPSSAAPAAARAGFDELRMLTSPAALNLDHSPLPNGISVQVYALSRSSSKTVPITAGELELLIFDGVARMEDLHELEPHLSWTYPAEQLRRIASQSVAGIGYGFILRWDHKRPKSNSITVVARYRMGENRFIYTSPVSIALTDR